MRAQPGGPRYHRPPIETLPQDALRHVGVELEFTGVTVPAVAAMLAERLGGRVEADGPYVSQVTGTEYGSFRVEMDSRWLTGDRLERSVEGLRSRPLLSGLADAAVDLARATITPFVPVEIVTPPLPLDALPLVDDIVRMLRRAGAEGSQEWVHHAFALQLNPEAPSLEVDSIRRHVTAFALLAPALRRRVDMSFGRWISRYATPYPRDYVLILLRPNYRPDLDDFVEDYLVANPTRNRALDMLPLLSLLRPEQVRRAVDSELVKSRPTYHYRLPSCKLGVPDWSVAREWNHWVAVERLAADEGGLAELAARRLHCMQRYPLTWERRCRSEGERWLG